MRPGQHGVNEPGLFTLDDHPAEEAFFRQAQMAGGLGDHGQHGTERGFGAGSIDPGTPAIAPSAEAITDLTQEATKFTLGATLGRGGLR
jgi:hypothetical protein